MNGMHFELESAVCKDPEKGVCRSTVCVIYYMLRAITESSFQCQRDVITVFNLAKHTVWIIHSLVHYFYSLSLIPAIRLGDTTV